MTFAHTLLTFGAFKVPDSKFNKRLIAATTIALAAALAAPLALAQPVPTPEQMIEMLKTPRTRSLRNLNVEAASPKVTEPTTTAVPAAQATGSAEPAANTLHSPPSLPASARPSAAAPAVAVSPPAEAAKPSLSLLIQFDLNSARVKPESQLALENLATALKSSELLPARFLVEGHTDATGRADLNLNLSKQRAEAVREILLAQGIAQQRLQALGKGASDLANKANPASFENRRVRIVNIE
jgi:outer membrane protein OmpA-like peptidoglycan-associated protein